MDKYFLTGSDFCLPHTSVSLGIFRIQFSELRPVPHIAPHAIEINNNHTIILLQYRMIKGNQLAGEKRIRLQADMTVFSGRGRERGPADCQYFWDMARESINYHVNPPNNHSHIPPVTVTEILSAACLSGFSTKRTTLRAEPAFSIGLPGRM